MKLPYVWLTIGLVFGYGGTEFKGLGRLKVTGPALRRPSENQEIVTHGILFGCPIPKSTKHACFRVVYQGGPKLGNMHSGTLASANSAPVLCMLAGNTISKEFGPPCVQSCLPCLQGIFGILHRFIYYVATCSLRSL